MSEPNLPTAFRVHVAPGSAHVHLVAETSRGLENRGEVFGGLDDPADRLTLASALVHRWNAHPDLLAFVQKVAEECSARSFRLEADALLARVRGEVAR